MTYFRSSRRPSSVIPIRNRKRLNFAALALALSITAVALLFSFLPLVRSTAPPPLGHCSQNGGKDRFIRLNPPIDFSSAALSLCEVRGGSGQVLRQLQQQHPPQRLQAFCCLALLPAPGVAALPAGLVRRLRLCRGGQNSGYAPDVFPNTSPIRAGPDAAAALRLQFQPESI